MKFFALLLIMISLISCSVNSDKEMKISLEIIPEYSDGGYAIHWEDTLCDFMRDLCQDTVHYRFLEWRPFELTMTITNRNMDTLGYYNGLSSPRQWTWVQTKDSLDSVIVIHPVIRGNMFSRYVFEKIDSSSNQQEMVEHFNSELKKKLRKFNPLEVNINSILRNKQEFILEEQLQALPK